MNVTGPLHNGIVIRDCVTADLPGVSRLAGRLVREHHSTEPDRFMIFEHIEQGYAHYLRGELRNRRAAVIVAARDKEIFGYAYGRIEPRDWNALPDECGVLHDVYVDETVRRHGIAAQLVEEIVARLSSFGAPRVILMTAARNAAAQALFHHQGFRRTMIEMTRECPQSGPSSGGRRTTAET